LNWRAHTRHTMLQRAAIAALSLLALSTAGSAPHAQSSGGWGTATAPADTSIVPQTTRPNTGANAGPNSSQGTLILSAIMSPESPPIEQGMAWYIFRADPGPDGKRTLVTSSKAASPQLALGAGEYFVTAAYGRATLTRKVTIAAGAQVTERFDLQAGGLKVLAVLPNGEAPPERSVVFDVLNEERDQEGNRVRVVSAARPGLILRLNAGVYQIVSTYGDVNAKVRAEVTVYPGKLTEATLAQTGAKVTFKLVGRPGGDALADVTWNIIDTKAQIVKETAGAVPTHILAPGRYAVQATRQGRTVRVEFTAKAGDATIVEVVAK
jgi:hypothetical protein